MASAAYLFTFTRNPAYTGSIATMTDQLTRALGAVDANEGHAGPNNDAALRQKVITDFFFANRDRISAINVERNGSFYGYVDEMGYKTTEPATTGVGVQGNAAVTLTHDSAAVQVFDTALTAARAVTLPAASAAHSFRVVRGANATGAFNLTVQTPASAVLWTAAAVKAWADFHSDGTNWYLTAAGTLP